MQSNIHSLSPCQIINCYNNILEAGIEAGQGINIGPGQFVQNIKCWALNKHRAWEKWPKRMSIKLEKICSLWKELLNVINIGPLIRTKGLENPKLLNLRPTGYRVCNADFFVQCSRRIIFFAILIFSDKLTFLSKCIVLYAFSRPIEYLTFKFTF